MTDDPTESDARLDRDGSDSAPDRTSDSGPGRETPRPDSPPKTEDDDGTPIENPAG